MCDALVYRSPSPISTNSIAKSSPAAMPALPEPSLTNTASPCQRIASATSSAAMPERMPICISGGMSVPRT